MSLLRMSASGAVMLLVIAAVRALAINRLPKKTFLALWAAVLARLLVPFSLPSALCAYSLLDRMTPAHTPVSAMSTLPVTVTANATHLQVKAAETAASADPWTVLWLMGALACGAFFAAVYRNCRRQFRTSLPVEHPAAAQWLRGHPLRRRMELRQSDRISAPLTYGIFHPVILLPKTTDWEDREGLSYVLAHELVHIRRWDAVTKLALTAALCIHWFNPAVWAFYVLANRDLELSCDEAVIRQFGREARAAYAMTLIRMEERRGSLTPLGSHFSKNAIEERIVSIMKIKKTSRIALVAAVLLVAGVTTAFATSPRTEAETAMESLTVMSYVDPDDGKTWFSADNGQTWEEENPFLIEDIQWWTAEEYEAWMKEQQARLQSMLGERSWNPTEGWYTWDQARIDQAIEDNARLLEEIKDGKMVSKPTADGDAMIQISYDPDDIETAAEDGVETMGDTVAGDPREEAALLEACEAFGLTRKADGTLFWKDRRVRYFTDEAEVGDGTAIRYCYYDKNGVVDIHTVREPKDNGDGSVDPFGPLKGLEAASQKDFDRRTRVHPLLAESAEAQSTAPADETGETFAQRFARYRDFGITYAEAADVSGAGNVYYHGQNVARFSDAAPDGSVFSFDSQEPDGVRVRTVYNDAGSLTGVEIVP